MRDECHAPRTTDEVYMASNESTDNLLQVDVVTPEGVAFSERAGMVTAPGTEGVFGVLPKHAPFITTLKAGVIEINGSGEGEKKFFITGGVAEVSPETGCTILAEGLEDAYKLTDAEIQSRIEPVTTN